MTTTNRQHSVNSIEGFFHCGRDSLLVALGLSVASGLAIGVQATQGSLTVWKSIVISIAAILMLAMAVLRFEWVLVLAVIAMPLNYIDLAPTVGIVVSPARVMAALLLAGWVARAVLGRRPRSTRLDLLIKLRHTSPLLLLLLLLAVSVVFSRDQANSVSSLPALAVNLSYFFIILDTVRSPEQFRRLCLAATGAIAIVALTASQGFLSAPLSYLAGIDRITGGIRAGSLFDQANRTAHTLAGLYPFTVFLVFTAGSKLRRAALLTVAGLSAIALLLTFSRGGMLAFLLGMLTIFRRQALRLSSALLAALLLAFFLLSPFSTLWAANLERPASDARRLEVLSTGVKAALEYPLTGVGYGNFGVAHRYTSTEWSPNLFYRTEEGKNKAAHDLYLMFLVETGLLSLPLWMLFWGLLFMALLSLDRKARARSKTRLRSQVLCLEGAAVAVFMSRLVNTGFGDLSFWTGLGLLICGISLVARDLRLTDESTRCSPFRPCPAPARQSRATEHAPQEHNAPRILLLFGSLERGGAQLRTLEVCQALRERHAVQFDICWLGLGPNHLEDTVATTVDNVYYLPIKSPRFILDFVHLLRRGRYASVNVLCRLPSPCLLWLARLCGVQRRIASIRNAIGERERGLSSAMGRAWYRWTVSHCATDVVAVSRSTMDSLFPQRWRTGAQFHVVYNGFELAALGGDEQERDAVRSSVRREFGWPPESRIIVNVGRLTRQKNQETVIAATRKVYETDHKVRLLLVGDGRQRQEVQQWLAAQGIDHVAALAAVRTDVPRLLQAADVFFFPSRWEGLPGALIEALGAGLPVVASNIEQIVEVAQYFPGALRLAPPEDTLQHASHLQEALNGISDRDRQQTQFAQSPFDMQNCVQAYANLYGCTDDRRAGQTGRMP